MRYPIPMIPRVCFLPAAALTLVGACFQNPGELEACTYTDPTFCDAGAAASTAAGQTSTSTTEVGSSASTSGGEDSGSDEAASTDAADSGTTWKVDAPIDLPPWVKDLELDPPEAFELGPTLVQYQASPDAVSAQLLDDGVVIAEAPVGEPLVFPVTSAPHNNPGSILSVVVRDEAGQIGTDEIYQPSNVKAPGSAVWTTQEPGDGQFSIGAAVALQGPFTVTAGVRWVSGKLVGTLRRYDQAGKWKGSDTGWTKDHPSWTTIPEMVSAQLSLSAVAVDAEGYIVAAGTALLANEQRMYLVRFKPDGERDWEVLEGVGTSGRGLAVQPDGTIYVTGSIVTNKMPERTDLMTWVYDKDRTAHGPDQFNDPEDWQKKRSERGRAAVVMKDGRVVVVGMAEILVTEPMEDIILRTVAIAYEGKGTRVKVWTSPGDKGKHDAGLAAVATEEGFALCGYGKGSDVDKTQILARWLSADLEEVKAPRLELTQGSAQCNALAYNREGSLILGTEVINGVQSNDIWIFAVRDAASPLVHYLKRNGIDNGDERAMGLACDYMCGWVGAETVDGAIQWIAGLFRG